MGRSNLVCLSVVLWLLLAVRLGSAFLIAEPPSAERLAQGSKIYDEYCRQCHLAGNSRIKRLNLIDAEWRHGDGSLEHLMDVVAKGIDATQMEPFEDWLSTEEIRAVCEYVLSLSGNPKGEIQNPN